ncbi:MAG: carbamoyltransferase HypF [Pleurocapsa minor GSE-CHR-MK-17-07R]|jgi:hydrogenase maturation protein HypF|nr:carbamoyltransferase HypF [Pleurocapsa minor GSE-CHR-MK 17-07R]
MSERRRLVIQGAVQGVGFRPFIYRLAADIGIRGWVSNSAQGVLIEAEAPGQQLDTFLAQIDAQKPPHSFIQHITVEAIPATGEATFEIRHSSTEGSRSAVILPDLATCPDCLRDIFDPANRRYRFPFTNCTHCGPRYSIIERLPYDRPNTTMQAFVMCEACRAEYENPLDRRFHAQPNACPVCGPQISLWNQAGEVIAAREDALGAAVGLIRGGAIVALKGLGGFQLLVDARQPDAVQRLRARKQRPDKPFAVMFPMLEQVKAICDVSDAEAALLGSSEAPIVLLRRHGNEEWPAEIAPGNPNLGVMLPYTPLHHLLMAELGFPVVATSGNLSGEPLCTDEHEALTRLNGIADYFLVHNRPIARPVDDSVTRVMAGTACTLRRARGYAPLPVQLPESQPMVVAVGPHLKNTIAISISQQVVLSQHIGDLETPEAVSAFQHALKDLQSLYQQQPEVIACDLHPDYYSTQVARDLARQFQAPLVQVQHHYAHVLACMVEHRLTAPVLGVTWDGTGYGTDGTIWGGEFLHITEDSFERVASLRPFRLPGGEKAIREPRRAALGLLFELYGEQLPDLPHPGFSPQELAIVKKALARKINAPLTSSMGRLFDGVAALIGLRQRASFEGQAAMALEFACEGITTDRRYPFTVSPATAGQNAEARIIEWGPVIEGILADLNDGLTAREIAAVFHNTLVDMIVIMAIQSQIEQVVLSGGCFQNKRLLEDSIARLQEAGFRPYWSQKIPANDGGIALGQIAAAQREYAWRQHHVSGSAR